MERKVKVKGSEIIERWNKANELTKKLGRKLGEKGYYFRQNGYDVWYDGFNTCTFSCKDIKLSFHVYNWTDDSHWELSKKIHVEDRDKYIEREDWMYEYSDQFIRPEREYEFEHNLSIAELFEKGIIYPKRFKVAEESPKALGGWMYFDSFKEADEYAKNLCQRYIDRRFNDHSRRQYYMTSVRNNVQGAREHYELRHYSWYKIDGRDFWITIKPSDY